MDPYVLSCTSMGNDPNEAMDNSPFRMLQKWKVKEIRVILLSSPELGPANWTVEAHLEQVENANHRT